MWIGTRNGLYRYMGDGAAGHDIIYEGDTFYDIQQDSEGRIWVKKRNGYVVYDPRTCTFLDEQEAAAVLSSEIWIETLHIDGETFFWNEGQEICMRTGDAGNKIHAGNVTGRVYDICSRNGIAYVLTVEGRLYRYAYDGNVVTALPVMGPGVTMPEDNMDYRFHCVFVDSAQNIWLSQGANGVWLYPAGSDEGTYLYRGRHNNSIQGGFICAIEEDAEGNIWLASDHGGISVCSMDGRVLARLRNDPEDSNTISGNGVYALYRDRDDNIWVGYTKKGMSIYRGENKIWSISHLLSLHKDSFPDDINSTCMDDEGNIWFGTDGYGLVMMDVEGNETVYRTSDSKLGSNVITDVHCDASGRIWIGTFYGGMSCIDDGVMRTYKIRDDDNSLASMNVWSIDHDHAGRIWIGTLGGGLQVLDPGSGRFDTFNLENGSISNDFIHKIICADDGNVYVATSHGLSIFNPQTRTSRIVAGTDGMLNEALTGMYLDSRGLVWLDEDGILQVYDPATGMFFSPEHPSLNAVRDILEDGNNSIWVVTDSGLSKVDVFRSTEKGYAFDVVSFGFTQHKELHFNQRSSCICSDGDFIIGSFCGYLSFSPERYMQQVGTRPVQLYFTRLYAGNSVIEPGREYKGRIVLDKALEYTESVVLDQDESVISISYAILDYFSLEEQNLYYCMQGLSDEWIAVDRHSNRLTFTNLAPGRYKLWLTSDESDVSGAVSLSIRIRPPWWASWWAVLLYVFIFLSGLVVLALNFRKRQRDKDARMAQALKQERRHYVDEMKMQFFTNVSHDFRTPLTLILTPVEDRIAKDPQLKNDPFIMNIHRNAKRLNDLVTEVLDFRHIETYGADLQLVKADLVNSVRESVSSFRLMAESQDISLEMTSYSETLVFDFDNGKVLKIITNLLSNAFKFTPKGGSINVDIRHTDDGFVKVEVKDSGCGIPDKDKRRIFDRFYQVKGSASGSGIGLHVVREFVLLHGGEVNVTDNKPQGTIFSFTLPIRKDIDAPAIEMADRHKDSAGEHAGKRPVVLIVDDNDDFRTFMCASLSDEYEVCSASDGAEALKVLEGNDVDVVISDVMMPVMDGIELCRKIKSDINTSHIPVILLTAKSLQGDECNGLEAGADDYLTKPFNMSILRLRVAKFIEWKQRSKRLFEKELEITTEQITLTSMDDRLLQSAINVINENISNPDFSVVDLSAALYMHRASLYKKLLYITGKTPVEFIRAIRLKRAATLLETDGVYISEIAYMVGFNSPKIFASHFKEEFGCSPSEYRKKRFTSPSTPQ